MSEFTLQTQGAFDRTPETFVFKYVTRTSFPDLLSFQPERSLTYLEPALTDVSLIHFSGNA